MATNFHYEVYSTLANTINNKLKQKNKKQEKPWQS